MTFEEVLDQAMAMLQRRGRLTYRTLQLHFHLDDESLEALKDELIYGQRLAVDEDGRVLVWTGGVRRPPAGIIPSPSGSPRTLGGDRASRTISRRRTPPAHRAVLRSGGLHRPCQPARPGRLPRGGAGLSADLRRGHPAL